MIDFYEKGSKKFSWWQDWRGECVAIVGGGPSAKTPDLELLRDRIHVIVVNDSYKLCPWADILYSCDVDWWEVYEKEVKSFRGMKLTMDDPIRMSRSRKLDVENRVKIAMQRQVWVNEFLFEKPGEIGSGGNSGFQMINLSAQFGATGIALVGFDMHPNGGVHWHGRHPSPLRNPDLSRFIEWRKDLDEKAPKLKTLGIDVVNCCTTSALTAFPKMTINQMLERWTL